MSNRSIRVSVLALSMTAVATTSPVNAELCTIDQVPAATLLVPHFQVDLDSLCGAPGSGAGITTLFTIRNTRAEPVLTQVNLWSDVDLPVGGFPVYLDGYDTQSINLADVLCNGVVPTTGTLFSERGSLAAPQVTFPLCQNGGLLEIPMLSPGFVAHLQASLTGNPSPLTGLFSGVDFGDNVARGYVTVDTIEVCDSTMPSDPGYFLVKATNENVLLGDYQIVDPANNFAFGETAVAVEAAEVPFFVPGDMTFYGRYVGETGEDQREPLPTTFLVPRTEGSGDTQTQLIVWREGSNRDFGAGFPCPFCEPNFPLGANQVTQLTDEGEPLFPPPPFPGEPSPPPIVPALASELIFDTAILGDEPAATERGSIYMNLQTTMSGRISVGQAWVVAITGSQGRFETGNDAVPLDSGCPSGATVTADAQGALASNPIPTGAIVFPEIFKDGFE